MEEAPENGKESSHAAHANGMELEGLKEQSAKYEAQQFNCKFGGSSKDLPVCQYTAYTYRLQHLTEYCSIRL